MGRRGEQPYGRVRPERWPSDGLAMGDSTTVDDVWEGFVDEDRSIRRQTEYKAISRHHTFTSIYGFIVDRFHYPAIEGITS